MNGGWLRVLAIGAAVGAVLLFNGILDRTFLETTAQPQDESNVSGDDRLARPGEVAQGSSNAAVQQISGEGDRLVGEGRFREAIDYYTAALALDPRSLTLYCKRSALYQRIGETALADRDRQYVAALSEYHRPQSPISISLFPGDGISISTPTDALIWGGGIWLLLTIAYCWAGYRQSREGGGTIRRLIGVAAAAAVVALSPLFVWMVVQVMHPVGFVESTEALLVTGLSSFWMALVLRPPLRPYPSRPRLPVVEDETVIDRVKTLAKAMGIAPPRVRLMRSVGGAQRVLAWAGGLPKPIIIVTDG
ncbi:MAG TPA: hypothetical protein VKB78_14160, partial [Pirellulales bacterium]|nr:hypothetical protein [Pirellulales bacterium]